MENMVSTTHFWQGKKVLVTGHTGFKGSWLSLWLQQLGAQVLGLSFEPVTQPNLFETARVEAGMTSIIGDICDLELVKQTFQQFQPDIVIHMAAQALVRVSYQDPVETYQTNVMGTVNILEGIRTCGSVQAAIMVTTDKCYDNKEWSQAYHENDALGGHEPYSSSKACAELLIDSYRRSFFDEPDATAIASVRAGNVIGGGDWAQDRLIPDIVRAKAARQPLTIRYPQAIRPWQHVLDPLHGYLLLAEKLFDQGQSYAQAWNFGPLPEGSKSVQWIADYFVNKWDYFEWQLEADVQPHEAVTLKLDCTKAHERLTWRPLWTISETLSSIDQWYEAFEQDSDMKLVCLEQIEKFSHDESLALTTAI